MVQTFTSAKPTHMPRKEGSPCVSSISREERDARYASINWGDYKNVDEGSTKDPGKWKKVYGERLK